MMSRSLFRKAVCCALSEWPALQIAVENSFGGVLTKKKARWLTEVTADFLENNKVSTADICEYLMVLMDQELSTLIEDDSLEPVSKQLLDLWSQYQQGDKCQLEGFIAHIEASYSVVWLNSTSEIYTN